MYLNHEKNESDQFEKVDGSELNSDTPHTLQITSTERKIS